MKVLLTLLIIFGTLFFTGCQPAAISTESAAMPVLATLPPSTSDTATSLPSEYIGGVDMPDLTPDPQAQKMIQLAKESLARKFKISVDQIHLSSVQAMVWPDASLGCPQAGIIYAQVMTPGFQILFEAVGQSFSYHTDDINRVILCRLHPVDEIFLTP